MVKTVTPPLARSAAPVAPTWDDVEPQNPQAGRDALGFSLEDRLALGLSERDVEITHFHTGDAHDALLMALQQGGAIGKTAPKKKGR